MITIIANTGEKIRIGKQGETGVCRILFPYLDATSIVLLHRRRGDAHPYSGTVERETIDGTVYAVWEILSVDTAVAGVGEVEVSYYKGETIAKTVTYPTVVDKSVEDGEITVPTASATWVQNVADKTAKAEAAKTAAETSAATATAKAAAAKAEADSLKAYPYDYTAELQQDYIDIKSSATVKENLYVWPDSEDPDNRLKVKSSSGVASYVFPCVEGQVFRIRKPKANSVNNINPNRFVVGFTTLDPAAGMYCLGGKAGSSRDEIIVEAPENAHYCIAYVYAIVKNGSTIILDKDTVLESVKIWRVTVGHRSNTEFYRLYSPEQCYDAFRAEMNRIAARIGMENSVFKSASGLTRNSVTTPADLACLALACAGNEIVLDWCGTTEIAANVYGVNARAIKDKYGNNLKNICIYRDDDPRYQGKSMIAAGFNQLGGKGGSFAWKLSDDRSRWGGTYDASLDLASMYFFKNFIYILDAGGHTAAVVSCVTDKSHKDGDDWIHPLYDDYAPEAAAEAAKMLEYRIGLRDDKPSMTHADAVVEAGGGYVAFLLPAEPAAYHSNFGARQMMESLSVVAANETVRTMPASVSKLLTALVASEHPECWNRRMMVLKEDIQDGSGSKYKEGDELRFDDAMRICLMESSNTLAHMIGREIGNSILLSHREAPAPETEEVEQEEPEINVPGEGDD